MKWEIKELKSPKEGEERTIIKFAFLPITCEDSSNNKKYIVWLENYLQLERWSIPRRISDFNSGSRWKPIKAYIISYLF